MKVWWQIPEPYGSMLHTSPAQVSSPSCWTTAIQKSQFLNVKYWRFFWKMVGQVGYSQKKDKIERAARVGKMNKTGDRKLDLNDSPEIPVRG